MNRWQDGTVKKSNGHDPASSGAAAGKSPAASNIDVLTRRTGTTLPIMSVKELAAALSEPQTKLYRHVKHLESAGLIRAVATRVVSGIIEQRYQASEPEIVIGDAFTEQEKVSQEA